MTDAWPPLRIRIVPNRYPSATAAAETWLRGSLWGTPLVLSGTNVQVYGLHTTTWRLVSVWFTARTITVVRS